MKRRPSRLAAIALLGSLLACAQAEEAGASRTVSYGELPVKLCLNYDALQARTLAKGKQRLKVTLQHEAPAPASAPTFDLLLVTAPNNKLLSRFSMTAGAKAEQPQSFSVKLPNLKKPGGLETLCFEVRGTLTSVPKDHKLKAEVAWQ